MTKAKKNLIIIGSIVGALVLLMILFGTLFNLRTIKVDYATSTFRVEDYSKTDIIKKSGIKKGKNIVFADYEKAESKLEKIFPYAKFNIVKTFPDTAIIYVYERTPVYKILGKDGFYYVFDEYLKCLEKVAPININENNIASIPTLASEGLQINVEVGEFLNNKNLYKKTQAILDGFYGFEETPIDIMSNITLSNDDILGTSIITMKHDSGATIIIQGDNLIKEKIAYALNVYVRDISQNTKYYGNLDKVTVTVYKDFTKQNKHIVVNSGTGDSE